MTYLLDTNVWIAVLRNPGSSPLPWWELLVPWHRSDEPARAGLEAHRAGLLAHEARSIGTCFPGVC